MFENIIDVQEVLLTLYYFVVLGFVSIACMWIFAKLTPYKDFELIRNGNIAVAIQFAGKILGITHIMSVAVNTNDSLLGAAVWGIIGFILMVVGYFIFEIATPKLDVRKEIEKGKVSVGIIAASISLAISFIISGAIS
ncbi:DUF350 domain-containing protein [Peribacillus simplex]|uniref:DUF350 domain-containing protein n=1 Tax=Peribacillus simplex TaxID=1478 RepID=UPI0011DE2B0F|nr:DUF350 domain-containing protein [Peribacillus simplex]